MLTPEIAAIKKRYQHHGTPRPNTPLADIMTLLDKIESQQGLIRAFEKIIDQEKYERFKKEMK